MGKKIQKVLEFQNAKQLGDITKQVNPIIYNADIGLRKWRSALADVQSSTEKIINVQVLHNSIGEGFGAGSSVKGWSGLLKAKLAAMFEDVGFGCIPHHLYDYYPTPLFTIGGTWVTAPGFGFNDSILYSANPNATAGITFVGTAVDILVVKGNIQGKFNASIDGGAAVEYDTFHDGEIFLSAISITGLSAGSHTLAITKVDDAAYLFLCGICPKKGTRGVRVNLVGGNGGTSWNVSTTAKVMFAEIDYWGPALTIIEAFTNDVANLTPTAYKGYMQTLISRAKAFGDVLLFPTGMREELYEHQQSEYFDALKELCITNNVCMVDAFNYWGASFTTANSVLTVLDDNVHPNAKGHQDLFNLLSKALFQ